MSGSKLATTAAIIAALAIGVVVGLAAPRDVDAKPAASGTTSATPMQPGADAEQWLADLAPASTQGRLDGMRVALVATATATDDDRSAVEYVLTDAGATVAVIATLGEEWWDAQWGTFRGELADNLTGVVQGAADASPQMLLSHAIAQALMPGALPAGTTASPEGSPDDPIVLDGSPELQPTDVIRTSLERAEILVIDSAESLTEDASGAPTTPAPIDAIVLVTGEGPEGGGIVAARAVAIWELYVPITVIVVAHGDTANAPHPTAAEIIDTIDEASAQERPSVVLATQPVLLGPQVVFGLIEQRDGGHGVYGTIDNRPTVPSS